MYLQICALTSLCPRPIQNYQGVRASKGTDEPPALAPDLHPGGACKFIHKRLSSVELRAFAQA